MAKDPFEDLRKLAERGTLQLPPDYRRDGRFLPRDNSPSQAALDRAKEEMKHVSSADLINSIDSTGYNSSVGPLENRLEWQELKRRLLDLEKT